MEVARGGAAGALRAAGGAAGVAAREVPGGGKASRYLERAEGLLAGGSLGSPRVAGGAERAVVRATCRSASGGDGTYDVEVRLGGAEGVAWSCTCPLLEKDPVCKHVLALLLFCEGHTDEFSGKEAEEAPGTTSAAATRASALAVGVADWTQDLIDAFIGKRGACSSASPVRAEGVTAAARNREEGIEGTRNGIIQRPPAAPVPGLGGAGSASPHAGQPSPTAGADSPDAGTGQKAEVRGNTLEAPPAKKAKVSAKARLAALGF